MHPKTTVMDIKHFVRLGHIEGISSLLLFFVAMPMKYLMDMPLAVKYVGTIHGGLFVAYILVLAIVGLQKKWRITTMILFFLASIFPGGPFLVDKRLIRKEAEGK